MNVCTCHTPECPSADSPVDMKLDYVNDDTGETEWVSAVYCGACGQQITDVEPPLPVNEREDVT